MREWCDALVAFLLAPVCAACGNPLQRPTRGCVCDTCWNAIQPTAPPLCSRCGGHISSSAHYDTRWSCCSACAATESVIEQARAIGPHTDVLRNIIHALKYDGRRSIAGSLAPLMRTAGAGIVGACDVVIPVPLHRARRRSRGFNHADDLADRLGPPVVHALVRSRNTGTQTALPAAERYANVAGAFHPTRHASALCGATVLLVDDVRTTGATLESCAATLKAAGIGRIFALTAARVETPDG